MWFTFNAILLYYVTFFRAIYSDQAKVNRKNSISKLRADITEVAWKSHVEHLKKCQSFILSS